MDATATASPPFAAFDFEVVKIVSSGTLLNTDSDTHTSSTTQ